MATDKIKVAVRVRPFNRRGNFPSLIVPFPCFGTFLGRLPQNSHFLLPSCPINFHFIWQSDASPKTEGPSAAAQKLLKIPPISGLTEPETPSLANEAHSKANTNNGGLKLTRKLGNRAHGRHKNFSKSPKILCFQNFSSKNKRIKRQTPFTILTSVNLSDFLCKNKNCLSRPRVIQQNYSEFSLGIFIAW